jgi:NAD+ kinase
MKAAVVGRGTEEIKAIVEKSFDIIDVNPDFVVCYGGDGTILLAERLFPSVPKLTIKKSEECRKCDYGVKNLKKILDKINKRQYGIKEEMKLDANGREALNEIQVRSKTPVRALRFSIHVGNKRFENLIGDGVIIATPFGSTGYYSSAGGKQFKKGIGICFNNLHNRKQKSIVVPEDSRIEVTVGRESGYFIRDNDDDFVSLGEGDVVVIKKSSHVARFIEVKS